MKDDVKKILYLRLFSLHDGNAAVGRAEINTDDGTADAVGSRKHIIFRDFQTYLYLLRMALRERAKSAPVAELLALYTERRRLERMIIDDCCLCS